MLRTAITSVAMPASFFLRVAEPDKPNLDVKLQLSMLGHYALESLSDIFDPMFKAQRCNEEWKQRRNISFMYHDESPASILVSKD